jgi:hypothetical protein
MSTSDRVGLTASGLTVLSPALWYFVGSVFLAALTAVVGVGLLLGWLSAKIHAKFVSGAARPQPPTNATHSGT